MSLSPVANRSFLHGDRKTSPTSSDKPVYDTLDSLALKRARLPLRLLPIDGNRAISTTKKTRKKKNACAEGTGRKSNSKVNASKRPAKSMSVIPSPASDSRRSQNVEEETASVGEQEGRRVRIDADNRDNTVERDSVKIARKEEFIRDNDVRSREIDQEFHDSAGIENSIFRLEENGRSSDVHEDEPSSDDYEKIELTPRAETRSIVQEGANEANERLERGGTVCSNAKFFKSKSTNDLTRNGISSSRERFTEEKLPGRCSLDNEAVAFGKTKKKKKRFAKNVLHYVPDYLVKGSKRTKKKNNGLSSSLSSLKPLSSDPEISTNSHRSRSLSREELKFVRISSPTNFVHLASATNPSLVLNEKSGGFGLEQIVITHEQKCATLPLLVARNEDSTMHENRETRHDRRSGVPARMPSSETSIPGRAKEEAARKNRPALDDADLKRELLSELRARSAKTLERCQQVKTSENQADAREGKLYELLGESTSPSPRANSSFLWSGRAKILLEDTRGKSSRPTSENIEDTDELEGYDDVGHLNFLGQESVYDDVGSPTVPVDENRIVDWLSNDCDSIYDDVMAPCNAGNDSTVRSKEAEDDGDVEGEYDGEVEVEVEVGVEVEGQGEGKGEGSVFADNEDALRRSTDGTGATERREDESDQGDGYYLSIANDYSSVDEEDTDKTQDDEQGVYDDVGLPSEERVNSLYAGSTTGSILGLTSTNGKESEWVYLDDSIIGLPGLARNTDLSTETPVISSEKESGESRPRKATGQPSRVSEGSSKSSPEPTPRDAAIHVAVSLGSGSVLLVGCTEKTEQWNRQESNIEENSQRTQGLVQMRVIDLDEDMDTQETSCYVHEDNPSDDTTYESLRSFQLAEHFSTDSETETETIDARDERVVIAEDRMLKRPVNACLDAPTKPTPPPPRESSLTQTLGRRIKMLRRTWSFTKGSLGRIRRRTSVDDDHSCEENNKESCNDHSNYDGGRYFNFTRHFKKSVAGFSTFYLNGYTRNGSSDSASTCNSHSYDEPVYSNIDVSREADHYSVLADQEPLYQFYAAAAARVAFDSNSDGYEEVEDMIPSQTATDLAKPGHRTLWCQTPQVVHGGLLQRLSMEDRKIQEAKFEILTSEASYLNSLRVLQHEFLNDPSINEILTPPERDKLFGGIPSVLHASERFLADLETVWSHDPMLQGLPDILIKYADKCLDIYVAYCSNQVSIDATLKDLRTRKGIKFFETVSQIETRPTCQSLSLHSFLMLPMQRITRLPLLTDAVLSKLSIEHADRSDWEKVFSSLSYVVAECNEGARAAAKEAEMESLARKLEYSVKIQPIVLKGKYLVKSGPVVQLLTKADTEYKLTFGKKFNKVPLYLLLLTDYLLVAKFKSNTHDETYTVIDTCKRNLIALESAPEDSPFAGRNAMLLTLLENYSGRQAEYILTCESNTERQRWLEAVSPSKRGLLEETLYESWDCPQVVALYSYSPNQPDELSLHPGDVINVLRKMSDGWFHGEKLLDGEQGWFPGNYIKEVASEHVRAKNLKQRHRLLTLSGSVLQRKVKQQSAIY